MFDQYNEWLTDRLGKFTASDIWKLMEKGKGAEYFGKGAKTYIRQKAAEILTQEPVNGGRLNTAAMEWGSAHEHEAIELFKEQFRGKDVIAYGGESPKFFDYTNFSGGSPDGVTDDNEVLEVKCPYNSSEHVEHLLLLSGEDLKGYYPEAYWQILFNMLCTGLDAGYFISYDPRFAEEPLRLKIIRIEKDEADLLLLKERVAEAEKQLAVMIGMVRDLLPENVG